MISAREGGADEEEEGHLASPAPRPSSSSASASSSKPPHLKLKIKSPTLSANKSTSSTAAAIRNYREKRESMKERLLSPSSSSSSSATSSTNLLRSPNSASPLPSASISSLPSSVTSSTSTRDASRLFSRRHSLALHLQQQQSLNSPCASPSFAFSASTSNIHSSSFARIQNKGVASSSSSSSSSLAFWPRPNELRRVFRLFDRDNDGKISTTELRHGLVALGFQLNSTTNITRLTQDLKKDDDGFIHESSFVRAFRKLNREKIQAELEAGEEEESAEYKHMKIILCEMSEQITHELKTPTSYNNNVQDTDTRSASPLLPALSFVQHSFPPSQLASYLTPTSPTMSFSPSPHSSSLPQQDTGTNTNTNTNAGTTSGITSATNPSIRKRRKLLWIDLIGLHSSSLSFLSNHFSLPPECFDSTSPSIETIPIFEHTECKENNTIITIALQAMSIVDQDANTNNGATNRLSRFRFTVNESNASATPKTLSTLPINIICVGDHTVISLHPLTQYLDESDIFAEFRSLLASSFERNIPITLFAGTLQTLHAHSLFIELMDEITDWSCLLRDQLQHLKNDLQRRLNMQSSRLMLSEIHSLNNISLHSVRTMQRICDSFMRLTSMEEQDDLLDNNSVDFHENAPHSKSHLFTQNEMKSSYSPVAVKAKESRRTFSSDHLRDLQQLTQNNKRLYQDLKLILDLITPMTQYYRQMRVEQTNEILFVLTVLTALVTPLQLTSGIYGMNLASMPEQTWQYSYLCFWIGNITLMVLIAAIFRHKNWL